MRFKAKTDYVSLALVSLFALLFLSTEVLFVSDKYHLSLMRHRPFHLDFADLELLLAPILGFSFSGLHLLPRYFDLRDNGLFVRQNGKKTLIPYAAIYKLLPISREKSWVAPNRILVILLDGNSHKLAVLKRDVFLTEIAKRCPQLERRETAYGLSLQQPIS